jgi:hypothetical protein
MADRPCRYMDDCILLPSGKECNSSTRNIKKYAIYTYDVINSSLEMQSFVFV